MGGFRSESPVNDTSYSVDSSTELTGRKILLAGRPSFEEAEP